MEESKTDETMKGYRAPRTWAWWNSVLDDGDKPVWMPVQIVGGTRQAGIVGYLVDAYRMPIREVEPFRRLLGMVERYFVRPEDLRDMKSAVTHLQCRLTEASIRQREARERYMREMAETAEELSRTEEQIRYIALARRDEDTLANLQSMPIEQATAANIGNREHYRLTYPKAKRK